MGDNDQRVMIQRGELPATNVRELVDAIRQDLAGIGAELSILKMHYRFDRFDRFEMFLHRLNNKTTLALEHYTPSEHRHPEGDE